MELQVVNQMEDGVPVIAESGPRKFTPRKKQLATKVRKTPPKKKRPGKKKGKK